MKTRDKKATKKHILDTAREKFAERGYDGASISHIAKAAGVNQALIYYYFENKQALLNEILDDFISTANGFLIELARKNYEFGTPEMELQMEKYNRYLLENEKTLRLLLTESLKDSTKVPPIFKLIDFHMEGLNEKEVISQLNKKGFNLDKEEQQRRVTEFFTGIMPVIIFSLFRKKWCRHFDLPPEELNTLFTRANEMTHGRHHKKAEH